MSKKLKAKFSLAQKDSRIVELLQKTNHRTIAIWAKSCAERVLPFFESFSPPDHRPRSALATLQAWIETGEFKMSIIRAASLSSHAAAREVNDDNSARSAARSAGQAVATAHVRTHAIAAANYAIQAIWKATEPEKAEFQISQERNWQYQHLLDLTKIQP